MNNKDADFSQQSNTHKFMYALNLKEAIDKSTTHNDMDMISLHVCKWNRPDVNMTLGVMFN